METTKKEMENTNILTTLIAAGSTVNACGRFLSLKLLQDSNSQTFSVYVLLSVGLLLPGQIRYKYQSATLLTNGLVPSLCSVCVSTSVAHCIL